MAKNELVVFTPLPPTKSGIADYNAELMPHLAKYFELTCVVDDDAAPNPLDSTRILTLGAFRKSHHVSEGTQRLYHFGNNPHHIYLYEEFLKNPGTVVLHDFLMHHLMENATLGRGDWYAYEDLLFGELGRLGSQIAWSRRAGCFSEAQKFLLPLNRHIATRATGLITHSQANAKILREDYGCAQVAVVAHHNTDGRRILTREEAADLRAEMGLPREALVVAAFGFVTDPKQIPLTLRALAGIKERLGDFIFLVVGEPPKKKAPLEKLIRQLRLQRRVRFTGYAAMEDFEKYVECVDVVVNLRYPSAGETSGTLIRCLARGKPAIVFDYGTFGDYPGDTLVKIPLDTQNTGRLEEAILQLAGDARLREKIGEAAREYLRRNNDIEKCAAAYAEFIERAYAARRFTAARVGR